MTRSDAVMLTCLAWLGAGLALVGPGPWTILPPILAFAMIAADGIVRPAAPWLLPVVTHGDRRRPAIALTFDDGPDPETTPRLLELLARHGAHATFFLIGSHAEQYPELVRRLAREGHEIGNHTYAHPRLLNLARSHPMQREIERGQQALQALAPSAATPSYRPPVGLKSPWLARVQRRLGLRVVLWSLHARDTGRATAEQVAHRVLTRIGPGDIVVMHDGHDICGRHRRTAVAALELVLPELDRRGLKAVTVEQLLGAQEAATGQDCASPMHHQPIED